MNINIVYISDNLTDFHVDDPTTNWITNCYGENFYAVNTGEILSKEAIHKLPFRNVSNSAYHEARQKSVKSILIDWWDKVHPNFLLDFGFPLPDYGKVEHSELVKQWAKWMSAIDIINIDNNEASSTCVLTSDVNLIPKDLPELASKLHKDKWQTTVGSGPYENTPINGSLDIFVDSEFQIIVGHYHALHQMFKEEQLKWFLGNLHLTGSSLHKFDKSFLHMMTSHIGLRINEIT